MKHPETRRECLTRCQLRNSPWMRSIRKSETKRTFHTLGERVGMGMSHSGTNMNPNLGTRWESLAFQGYKKIKHWDNVRIPHSGIHRDTEDKDGISSTSTRRECHTIRNVTEWKLARRDKEGNSRSQDNGRSFSGSLQPAPSV